MRSQSVALLCWIACNLAGLSDLYADPEFKGMSYTAFGPSGVLGTANSNASLLKMSQMGADTVALNTWWYQTDIHANTVGPYFAGDSEPTSTIGAAIDYIHSLGMKVLFKPMLDSGDGNWRAYINPTNPSLWFGFQGSSTPSPGSYGDYISQMGVLAQQHNVELFSVGCEMNNMERYSANWQQLIDNVKTHYTGKLTYSANWSAGGIGPDGFDVGGGYNSVTWWNKLNYIGVDAYFPLTGGPGEAPAQNDPSFTTLQTSWNLLAGNLNSFRTSYNTAHGTNLNMLFTEVGYSSYQGTNTTPWQSPTPSSNLDTSEQLNCYRALLSVMSQQSWWDGAFFWNWETNPNAGGAADKGFTPQGKLAQQVAAQFCLLRGDFNLDHRVTNADLQAMLGALANLQGYAGTYFFSPSDMLALGDFNGDGTFNVADLPGELNLLTGNSGGGSIDLVPEPPSLVLLCVAALLWPLMQRRRQARLQVIHCQCDSTGNAVAHDYCERITDDGPQCRRDRRKGAGSSADGSIGQDCSSSARMLRA